MIARDFVRLPWACSAKPTLFLGGLSAGGHAFNGMFGILLWRINHIAYLFR
ncbi:hypothetical protein O9993_03920 [Vibrio lentus]|nr:hypothetical protein [Vibrio lentus]